MGALERNQAWEQRVNGQFLDVAGVDPGQQRLPQPAHGLGAQAAAQEGGDRLVEATRAPEVAGDRHRVAGAGVGPGQGPGRRREGIAQRHDGPHGNHPPLDVQLLRVDVLGQAGAHGGQLGEAYIHGMNSVVEGVRQVLSPHRNPRPAGVVSDAQVDPYKALQVDPEAEDEVIAAAYRRHLSAIEGITLPATNKAFLGEGNPNASSCSVHVALSRTVTDNCSGTVEYDVKIYPFNGTEYILIKPTTTAVVDTNGNATLSFDINRAGALFESFHPTLFFGVPTIYVRLLELPADQARRIQVPDIPDVGSRPVPEAQLVELIVHQEVALIGGEPALMGVARAAVAGARDPARLALVGRTPPPPRAAPELMLTMRPQRRARMPSGPRGMGAAHGPNVAMRPSWLYSTHVCDLPTSSSFVHSLAHSTQYTPLASLASSGIELSVIATSSSAPPSPTRRAMRRCLRWASATSGWPRARRGVRPRQRHKCRSTLVTRDLSRPERQVGD